MSDAIEVIELEPGPHKRLVTWQCPWCEYESYVDISISSVVGPPATYQRFKDRFMHPALTTLDYDIQKHFQTHAVA